MFGFFSVFEDRGLVFFLFGREIVIGLFFLFERILVFYFYWFYSSGLFLLVIFWEREIFWELRNVAFGLGFVR